MISNIENTWGDDENNQPQGGGANSFGIPDNGDTNRNAADDFSDEETGDESLETDDDLLADDDTDYDEDNLDDTEGGGTTTTGYSGDSGSANSPDETPEERESDNEGTGYSTQTEINQPREGADTSYSEQNDVTPPNPHEFPSVGTATKTDFASRPHGRTTGRMVGHEPGTEGI